MGLSLLEGPDVLVIVRSNKDSNTQVKKKRSVGQEKIVFIVRNVPQISHEG